MWRTNKFTDFCQHSIPVGCSADTPIWERRLLYCVPVSFAFLAALMFILLCRVLFLSHFLGATYLIHLFTLVIELERDGTLVVTLMVYFKLNNRVSKV